MGGLGFLLVKSRHIHGQEDIVVLEGGPRGQSLLAAKQGLP